MGIEPTTSGLDLPLLCRLSYEVGQRRLFKGSISTSELILCSTICVLSATRHNIYMYPYFLFAAIHHLIVPDFLCPTSKLSRQSSRRSNPEVVGSIPTEVKRFFLYLVWFPDSLY